MDGRAIWRLPGRSRQIPTCKHEFQWSAFQTSTLSFETQFNACSAIEWRCIFVFVLGFRLCFFARSALCQNVCFIPIRVHFRVSMYHFRVICTTSLDRCLGQKGLQTTKRMAFRKRLWNCTQVCGSKSSRTCSISVNDVVSSQYHLVFFFFFFFEFGNTPPHWAIFLLTKKTQRPKFGKRPKLCSSQHWRKEKPTESGPQPVEKGEERPHKNIWMFPKIGVPQNGWFITENPIKMDDLGVPLFSETSIYRVYKL